MYVQYARVHMTDECQRNGKEWIECCGMWMHEDCVTQLEENDVTLCPICTEED